jgi:hypothetical protein
VVRKFPSLTGYPGGTQCRGMMGEAGNAMIDALRKESSRFIAR